MLKRGEATKSEENNGETFTFSKFGPSSFLGSYVHNQGGMMAVGIEATQKAKSCILKQITQECKLCADSYQAY